ncbi:MAG: hypothetical protein JWO52_7047 [Gammaproteobacteria bacterium]|nr:hypothetical protein [Gammaproteobacteria bacterium]
MVTNQAVATGHKVEPEIPEFGFSAVSHARGLTTGAARGGRMRSDLTVHPAIWPSRSNEEGDRSCQAERDIRQCITRLPASVIVSKMRRCSRWECHDCVKIPPRDRGSVS